MFSTVGWQVFVCFQHLWHTVIPVEHYLPNKTDNLMEHNLFTLNYRRLNCAPSDLHNLSAGKQLHGDLFGITRSSLIQGKKRIFQITTVLVKGRKGKEGLRFTGLKLYNSTSVKQCCVKHLCCCQYWHK